MRRGVDPSVPSSKPSSANPGFHEVPATTGRRPAGDLSTRAPRGIVEQPQPSLQRTLRSQPQPLPPPNALKTAPEAPWRARSPSYLKGKNPYGRILDDVEHPYRKPRTQAPGPPSQLGSSVDGRLRTSGSFKFATRPIPQSVSERNTSVNDSPAPPPPTTKRSSEQKSSVKNAKSLLETKASESGKGPPFPSEQAAIAKIAPADFKHKQRSPQTIPSMRITGGNGELAQEGSTRKEVSSPPLHCAERSAEISERRQSNRRSDSSSRLLTDNDKPEVVVTAGPGAESNERPARTRKSPGRSTEDAESSQSASSYAAELSASADNRPSNLFTALEQQALRAKSGEQLGDPSTGAHQPTARTKQPAQEIVSDETVRRRSAQKSFATETEKDRLSADHFKRATTKSPQTGHAVRRIAEQFECGTTSDRQQSRSQEGSVLEQPSRRQVSLRRHRHQGSHSARIEPDCDVENFVQRSRRNSPHNLNHRIETYVRNFGEPQQTAERLEEIAGGSLSHDGSGSDHGFIRRGATRLPDLSGGIGVQEGYRSTETPNHVDWRGGYGRRRTQDFGFPGARIKPHSTFNAHKTPLDDPGNWIKRVCGHFSAMCAIESREEAEKRACSQCRNVHPSMSMPRMHHASRKRSATGSITSNTGSSNKILRRYQQHCPEHDLKNKCGDAFAQDLGYIIDCILEEHQNTLQSVISNIELSQPNLAQLQRVSQDLIKRCGSVCFCTGACRNAVRDHVCQPCQTVCKSHQSHRTCQSQLSEQSSE